MGLFNNKKKNTVEIIKEGRIVIANYLGKERKDGTKLKEYEEFIRQAIRKLESTRARLEKRSIRVASQAGKIQEFEKEFESAETDQDIRAKRIKLQVLSNTLKTYQNSLEEIENEHGSIKELEQEIREFASLKDLVRNEITNILKDDITAAKKLRKKIEESL